MPAGPAKRAVSSLALLRRLPVALGMLAAGLFFMGQFALFTYLRPFLETVTQLGATQLSLLLLVIGVAGFIGTTLIGGLLKDGLFRVLAAVPLLMSAIAVALIIFGASAAAIT